jgi:hypothetical protein
MFEHLMFKSTRNLVSEQMDRLTEDVGGYNASTNDGAQLLRSRSRQPPATPVVRRDRSHGEPGGRSKSFGSNATS